MKPLYSEEEYIYSNSTNKLPCECYNCNTSFFKTKKEITSFLKGNKKHAIKFCSKQCDWEYRKNKIAIKCLNCNFTFEKIPSQIKKTKNHFCSSSCSAIYNNKYKTHGIRRSKLEFWLEKQLTSLYPNLQIDFNKKDVINSELDIYIPTLNIAFELNGIFHYEPIFGVDKLNQIQKNDFSKSKACYDAKIDLCTIDTSGQKYFKISTSQKYFDIIDNIIKERLIIINKT